MEPILLYDGTLDQYCVSCFKDSVFIFDWVSCDGFRFPKNIGGTTVLPRREEASVIHWRFLCTRCNRRMDFLALTRVKSSESKGSIVKIGQFPSIADLSMPNIAKYRKAFQQHYPDLARAIGLYTHGIGVGSFVYLRRIFEGLLEEAHLEAKQDASWNEVDYQRKRTDEKIGALKSWLPEFLVKNSHLYSILSAGIHTLSEEDCLNAFPVVRVGIEMILDQKLEAEEKRRKIQVVERALQKLGSKVK